MARLPDGLITQNMRLGPDGRTAVVDLIVEWKNPKLYRWIWAELKKANRDKSNVELMYAARLLIKEKHKRGCYGRS